MMSDKISGLDDHTPFIFKWILPRTTAAFSATRRRLLTLAGFLSVVISPFVRVVARASQSAPSAFRCSDPIPRSRMFFTIAPLRRIVQLTTNHLNISAQFAASVFATIVFLKIINPNPPFTHLTS
jgi:hypothetical protein